jgi:hypothetical protein
LIGVFGLLHGAQLASTFAQFGTPPAQFAAALIGFAVVVLGAEGAAVLATLLSASALKHRRLPVPAS